MGPTNPATGTTSAGTCPTAAVLSDFATGRLHDEFLETLATHLETCRDCEQRLTEIERSGDPWQQELRRGLSQSSIGPGSMVKDYEILALIGAGGMGRVWKARHVRMNRVVAIKFIARSATDLVARFQREVEVLASLAHPNVATAYDAGEFEGQPYLVMEFLEGEDLQRAIQTTPLTVQDAIDAVKQAALGLAHAHRQGLIHRDVKPSNLFRQRGGQVKLLDLGLARRADEHEPIASGAAAASSRDTQLTSMTTVMGTLDYAAPEQMTAGAAIDDRADVYGLGCTFYALVQGSSPFRRDSAQATLAAHHERQIPRLRGAPAWMARLAEAMIAMNPADRPRMADVAATLANGSSRWSTGRRAGFVAAVAVVLGMALMLIRPSDSPPLPPPPPPDVLRVPVDSAAATALQVAWARSLHTDRQEINTIGQAMMLIPPGEFTDHNARLLVPLRVAKTETTMAQFRQFVQAKVYVSDGERLFGGWFPNYQYQPGKPRYIENKDWTWHAPGFDKPVSEEHPVVQISWNDAVAFCQWLSEREQCRYRLPTLAESRWIIRAGSGTTYPFGDDLAKLGEHAWHDGNSNRRTSAVARLSPNAWGLHDTLGNTSEWLNDWANESMRHKSASLGSYFDQPAAILKPRGWHIDKGCSTIGFRVVRDLEP
jgi:serine/threonine protein kinase